METSHGHHDFETFDQEIDPDLLASSRGSGEINEIRYRMTHSTELTHRFNVAFSEYMRRFTPLKPEVFVLTTNSAIPVADAIRGWHDANGTPSPKLTYVRANRDLATATTLDRDKIIEQDTARLTKQYAGSRAVLMDQFVHSGSTLDLAQQMLEQASITVIGSTPEARWYNHAFGEIDLQNMTSEHVTFMRRVGIEATQDETDDEYWA